tara:strand:- start:2230 stop:3069 length:840 start_codon:yes stop_codon:yes gene_type:complete
MIHSDQIHMCRIVLLDMIEEAQEGEKYSVHINAIRNRIDRFIAPKQTRDILEILTFSDEVTHLGMGWYQPLSPIFIENIGVSIGCQHSITDSLFKNAYRATCDVKVKSLSEWLGLPFILEIDDGYISYIKPANHVAPVGTVEVYWADVFDDKTDENWFKESEVGLPEKGLLRVNHTYHKEFYQKNGRNFAKLTPEQAYELASLKDISKGLKVPMMKLSSSTDYIEIQPRRFMPKSLHLLAYLLAESLFRSPTRSIYRFKKESFTHFKSLCEPYIYFLRG